MSEPLFDPDKTYDRLLLTAARLFATKGFAGTTVRDLAGELGLTSGSLFHHVRSKDDILFAVMERVVTAMTRELAAALGAAPDTRARLRALIDVELRYLHGQASHATAVLFHEWRALPEARRALLLAGRGSYFDLWHQVLLDAQSQGLTQVDPATLRQFLHGALAWTSFWYRPDGTLSVADLADQAMRLIAPETVPTP